MNTERLIQMALDQGRGVLRLAPAWVPRSFCIPGRRLKCIPMICTPLAHIAAALMSAGWPLRPRPTMVQRHTLMRV